MSFLLSLSSISPPSSVPLPLSSISSPSSISLSPLLLSTHALSRLMSHVNIMKFPGNVHVECGRIWSKVKYRESSIGIYG